VACWLIVALVACADASARQSDRSTPPPDDRFIAGYAAAVLERELQISAATLRVENGVVTLEGRSLGTIERNKVDQALRAIPGVREVRVTDRTAPALVAPPAAGAAPVPADAAPGSTPRGDTVAQPSTGVPVDRYPRAVLGPGRLFEPLIADPRWPHFYASYNYFGGDGTSADLSSVGSVGFGETIAFVRQQVSPNTRIEGGLQAGVFAIFDLDADSKDLINADYFVGPFLSVRTGDFSLITRIHHLSSHLGDEYILRTNLADEDRVDLSYEAVDAIASYEFGRAFRVYGGAGYIVHQNESATDLDPWLIQYGVEYRSPTAYANGLLRPVAAADFQHKEFADFQMDLSLRAGFQIEDPKRFSQRMMLLLEYYNGRSPNGQFFDENQEFFGIGLHFYF
jgi:hypothetical protein